LFTPSSPLVFRTGRPFDQAGDPVSLDFPLPSTLAGACRTAIGDAVKMDFSQEGHTLKEIPVHGPLAALIPNDEKEAPEPLFPQPADSLYLRPKASEGQDHAAQVCQLKPGSPEADTWSDLPDNLEPVYLQEEIKGKPVPGAKWWCQNRLIDWLLDNRRVNTLAPEKLGWAGPSRELRTHVQLASNTLAAVDGQLFQTENLSFGQGQLKINEGDAHQGWSSEQYGLLVQWQDDRLQDPAFFRRIGGEGRIASVQRIEDGWPTIPQELLDAFKALKPPQDLDIGQVRGIRLILATPALFKYGWRPDWIKKMAAGLIGSPPGFPEITLQLKAFISPRWQPVSGWDLQKICPCSAEGKLLPFGCARAVRRMVPAGAVYWFEVQAGHEHLNKLWLQPISDLEQDQQDGYGLVLPGLWTK
ncbi:MAG: hypothetical protein D3923_16085, partial [Candidatus Electrothrix sp. AR3]|nr:hypothetical protein [Candidatus Electrothrix sp. AR3]